ncbi:MAG: hypothetical protein ACOYMN_08225 [Roseimicrobium sp.]
MPPAAPSSRNTLFCQVPGALTSLGIASFCLVGSVLLAVQYPMAVLHLAPRMPQPPASAAFQRIIMDATVEERLWGFVSVKRTQLRNVNHFAMHVRPKDAGNGGGAIRVAAHEGSSELHFSDGSAALRMVAHLNSQLDSAEPSTVTLRRADWPMLVTSWVLIVLGLLVLARNAILAPLQRSRASRSLTSRTVYRG